MESYSNLMLLSSSVGAVALCPFCGRLSIKNAVPMIPVLPEFRVRQRGSGQLIRPAQYVILADRSSSFIFVFVHKRIGAAEELSDMSLITQYS